MGRRDSETSIRCRMDATLTAEEWWGASTGLVVTIQHDHGLADLAGWSASGDAPERSGTVTIDLGLGTDPV